MRMQNFARVAKIGFSESPNDQGYFMAPAYKGMSEEDGISIVGDNVNIREKTGKQSKVIA